jgi:hypothetical protein
MNVALLSAVLAMMANGLRKDPKLVIRCGISEKKGAQCFFVQEARCASAAVFSASFMLFLRCMREGVAHRAI